MERKKFIFVIPFVIFFVSGTLYAMSLKNTTDKKDEEGVFSMASKTEIYSNDLELRIITEKGVLHADTLVEVMKEKAKYYKILAPK